jgi:hypothetical protein
MHASLAATPAMLKTDIYVQVFINRIRATNIGSGVTSDTLPPEPFSHPRMLVGHFLAAELAVKAAVAEVKGSKLFHTTRVLMHPMERLEGGLTQIERRVLHEMALTAGAGKVAIWEGHVLTDDEVRRSLDVAS